MKELLKQSNMKNTPYMGFLFGNYSDDNFKYQFLCVNRKSTWTFGIGTDDNSVENLLNLIKSVEGTNSNIPGGEQTAIQMNSMRLNEIYSIGNVTILCIRGEK